MALHRVICRAEFAHFCFSIFQPTNTFFSATTDYFLPFFFLVIKICGTPQDDCSEFATCTDTEPGKFTCTCNQGYTGDGKTCTGEIHKIWILD
jgi:hypothetical protein